MRALVTTTSIAAIALLSAAVPALAQRSTARDALEECVRAIESGREAEAAESANRAEAAFREWIEAAPESPEPRVGLARTLSQCRIPPAPMMEKGALVGRSNALLEKALELDPDHWGARFTLAMNHYHTPEFLGRTDDAIRHFEVLLEQQGDRSGEPRLAAPYAYLGDLYLRQGRKEEALEVWERGLELFPGDSRLAERIEENGPAAEEVSAGPPADSAAVAFTMKPLEVDVESGYAMDGARGSATLDKIDVYTAPGGTADVLQVFGMLPGVTRASEGSDLYVRGGDPEETPVLLEGARLLYPGVFETLSGGVFGILDPSVLRRAYFSSGGFSARWGDALSGIVALWTDSRPVVSTWRVGANLTGAGATARAPLGDRIGGWVAARATHTALLDRLHDQADEYPSSPRSAEGIAAAVWSPRPGTEVKAHALLQADRSAREIDAVGYRGTFETRGRSAFGQTALRTVSPDGARALHATLFASRRLHVLEFGVLDRERSDRVVGFRVEAEIGSDEKRIFRAGVEGRRLSAAAEGRVPTTERLDPGAPTRPSATVDGVATHLGAWIETELRATPSLAVVPGIRVDRLPGESGTSLDPRLALAWRTGHWTWRAGGGIFHQGRWRRDYVLPDRGSPAGIPRRARHLAVGLERTGEPRVRVEAYLKGYGDYVAPTEDPEPTAGPVVTRARHAGLDALVRWDGSERWDGWIAYSLLHGRLELEDGREVSSAYDVTHTVSVVGRMNLGAWQLGAAARYATGRPYTPILGAEPGSARGAVPEPSFGEPHGARLEEYVRLDGRITRFVSLEGKTLVAYVEILNLLDRENAAHVVYDEEWENPRPVETFFAHRTIVVGFELRP